MSHSKMSSNKKPLKDYMGPYQANFKRDLDVMYAQFDYDNNGVLDRKETRDFINELAKNIGPERSKNYNRTQCYI